MPTHRENIVPKVVVEKALSRRPHYEVEMGNEGWQFYDRMHDLMKERTLSYSFIEPGTRLEFGNDEAPVFIPIEKKHIKGLILRPMIRQAPYFDGATFVETPIEWVQTHYAFLPSVITYPQNWDFTRSEDGLYIECSQKYAEDDSGNPMWSGVGYYGGYLGDDQYVGACPNGFFAAGVRRQALDKEVTDYLQALGGYDDSCMTRIVWGNRRWMLLVPLIGRPQLYENVASYTMPPGYAGTWPVEWVARPWTEGNLEPVNARSMAETGKTYHIGAIGHCICVTESNFEDDFAYFRVQNSAEPVSPAGPVIIENFPGQATMWLDLNLFPSSSQSYLYRQPFEVQAYRDVEHPNVVWGQPQQPADALPNVTDNFAGDPLIAQYPGYPNYAHYGFPVARGQYPSTEYIVEHELTEELLTYTTPLVEAVTLYQDVDLTVNGDPGWEEIDHNRIALQVAAELGNFTAQQQRLTVDNRFATHEAPVEPPTAGTPPTDDIHVGDHLRLKAGWMYRQRDYEEVSGDTEYQPWEAVDGALDIGEYRVVEAECNAREAEVQTTDLLGVLNLIQWDTGELNARGWHLNEFTEWLLEQAGIGPEQYDIEDLDLYVPEDSDRGRWDIGTSYLRILAEAWEKSSWGGALWYDGSDNKVKTGCKYCRTKRTLENWYTHQSNGWNSDGCVATDVARAGMEEDLGVDFWLVDSPNVLELTDPAAMSVCKALKVTWKTISGRKSPYANRIVVVGQADTAAREPIVARWQNPTAIYYSEVEGIVPEEYVGMVVSHRHEDSKLKTRADVNSKLVELVHELSAWPRTIEATVPLLTTAKPGHVARLYGAKYAGANDTKFRVTGVTHNLRQHETTVEGREMASIEVEAVTP